jgi:hypothetical protein
MPIKTAQLVESVREHVPNGTDYAIAKALGLSQSDMPDILAGRQLIGNAACYKLAAILDLDPAVVVAYVEAERAERKGDAERASWWQQQARQTAARLRRGAAAVLVASASFIGLSAPTPSHATTAETASNVYYVIFRWGSAESRLRTSALEQLVSLQRVSFFEICACQLQVRQLTVQIR